MACQAASKGNHHEEFEEECPMRVANLEGRLVIVTGEAGHEIGYDVEKSSGGQFSADPPAVYDVWGAFTTWAAAGQFTDGTPVRAEALGSPAPAPRQVFGIGLNYREHVAESGFDAPTTEPPVFTKFPSCITGPTGDIEMPSGGKVDWEVELVVVIGRRAHRVGVDEAVEDLAGLGGGQGNSEGGLPLAA